MKAEDGKQTVAQYIAQVAKENGAELSVKRFVRFETKRDLRRRKKILLKKLQSRWECNFGFAVTGQ